MPKAPSAARTRWTALVAQHATSGQTLRAFAHDHGVNANGLAWWRGRLHRERREREAQLYQLGLPPWRIDLRTQVSGLTFDEAWETRVHSVVDGLELPVLGLVALLKNKRATGRTKDLLDVELLREAGHDVDE